MIKSLNKELEYIMQDLGELAGRVADLRRLCSFQASPEPRYEYEPRMSKHEQLADDLKTYLCEYRDTASVTNVSIERVLKIIDIQLREIND